MRTRWLRSRKLGLYFGGLLLIGITYLCLNTLYFESSSHARVQVLPMEVNVKHDVTTDATFLKSMMNLPLWYRRGDWGLRKNVSLETVKPRNEWAEGNDGEEITAWNNFFYGTTNGIILELGALDGKRLSISQFFEAEAGWRSILIEGNPISASQLPTNRPNAINFNVVICEEPRTVHFVQAGSVGGILEFMTIAFLSAFHSQLLMNVKNISKLEDKKLAIAKNVIKLPCVPLSDVLYPLNIHHINFFMLDTEGAELSVLKAIDFDKIKFDVIAVETDPGTRQVTMDSKEVTQKYTDSVIELVTSKGYVLWNRKIGRNSWFRNVHFTGFSKNRS